MQRCDFLSFKYKVQELPMMHDIPTTPITHAIGCVGSDRLGLPFGCPLFWLHVWKVRDDASYSYYAILLYDTAVDRACFLRDFVFKSPKGCSATMNECSMQHTILTSSTHRFEEVYVCASIPVLAVYWIERTPPLLHSVYLHVATQHCCCCWTSRASSSRSTTVGGEEL